MGLYLLLYMIKLVELSKQYKRQFFDMMDEWTNSKEKIIPYILNNIDYHYFDHFLNQAQILETNRVKAPSKIYFCLDKKRNIFIGAVVIRLSLNNDLLQRVGHISNGIRPSERNKGYGNILVKLAIEKCHEFNIKNILMVCDKTNIPSSKTIIYNKGILENEIQIENKIIQRYWIIGDKNE